eukprot:GEMP01060068.1.p1 GENE.GEMP01060068.1~~GEMP01060068.1.p1  ORF type:complete len:190 (+),score=55.55 GEMP01060068.1:307-876(+)
MTTSEEAEMLEFFRGGNNIWSGIGMRGGGNISSSAQLEAEIQALDEKLAWVDESIADKRQVFADLKFEHEKRVKQIALQARKSKVRPLGKSQQQQPRKTTQYEPVEEEGHGAPEDSEEASKQLLHEAILSQSKTAQVDAVNALCVHVDMYGSRLQPAIEHMVTCSRTLKNSCPACYLLELLELSKDLYK